MKKKINFNYFLYLILIILIISIYKNKNYFINHIYYNFKVDAVITWVDGNDKKWNSIKQLYENNCYSDDYIKAGKNNIRFENINELYYCIKSINKNLKWINNIYLVTMYPQKPNFLETVKNLKIIYHHEIFNDKNALPTFNSNAIESQLYNIKGLQENFIYFNDDCFIGKPLNKSYFFDKQGNSNIYKRYINNRYSKRVIQFLKLHGYSTNHFNPIHQAIPLKKEYFKVAWENFEKDLNITLNNKFRNINDIWIVCLISHMCNIENFNCKCNYFDISYKDNFYISFKEDDFNTNTDLVNNINDIYKSYKNNMYYPAQICLNNINKNNKFHIDIFYKFMKLFNIY